MVMIFAMLCSLVDNLARRGSHENNRRSRNQFLVELLTTTYAMYDGVATEYALIPKGHIANEMRKHRVKAMKLSRAGKRRLKPTSVSFSKRGSDKLYLDRGLLSYLGSSFS